MLSCSHAKEYTIFAYCNCVQCCGQWAKNHRTKDNSVPLQGITCAVPREIPFGSILNINNVGARIAQDRCKEGRIEIYFDSHKDALIFGKRKERVQIILNEK